MNLAVFIHAGIDVFQPFFPLLRIVEVFGKGMPPRFLAGPEVSNEDFADRQSFPEFVDKEQFMVVTGTDAGCQIGELVDFFIGQCQLAFIVLVMAADAAGVGVHDFLHGFFQFFNGKERSFFAEEGVVFGDLIS